MPSEPASGPSEKLPAAPDLRTSEASEFALWLSPRGAAATLFKTAMGELAEDLGGPVFAPHVTLWGRFCCSLAEAQQKIEVLTRKLQPVLLRGQGIGLEDDRFRALFVPAATTASLWCAHLAARDLLAPAEEIEFSPHLSLYYGNRPSARKLEALSRLDPLPPLDHVADSVTLVSIAGPPERWHAEAILPLRG